MKILATLLVRNEAEIVGDCLDHHLRQGVDGFLITDHLSDDELPDVLRDYRDVILDFRREEDPGYRQDQWVSRMARTAVKFSPDWIFHLDADERWCGLPWLAEVPSEFFWIRTGPWRNHLPVSDSPGEPFRARSMPYFEIPGRTGVHQARFLNSGAGAGGKILHRPLQDAVVGVGNHWLHAPEVPMMGCDQIVVHHYPVRSLEQFRRKVLAGSAALEANSWSPEIGSHWRHWRQCELEGRLHETFQSFLLAEQEIRQRLADCTLFLHQ